ncbi:MAG TPA: protein-L-isoaspartate(D-aspartate) O-methyltransferase [Phycisphaerae bacterium]|nr:protein-L-isoaspartate(D-aspartate) O-methyltransferase [Phycisphaerae bacterium]
MWHLGRQEEGAGDPYEGERRRMIEEQLRRRGIVLGSVLEAMEKVPRHLFVGHDYAQRAYADEALPSAEGQTISQPYMVAAMTQELGVKRGDRVLEVGTGTGYQTAILAELVGQGEGGGHVFTVERMAGLGESARRRLRGMGYENVTVWVGDGSQGWPGELWRGGEGWGERPRFERILVTAGAPEVPGPLVEQLGEGGVMIIPLEEAGHGDRVEMLTRVEKRGGRIERTRLFACRFVPLVGRHGHAPGE